MNCPDCGAPMRLESDKDYFTCDFCKNIYFPEKTTMECVYWEKHLLWAVQSARFRWFTRLSPTSEFSIATVAGACSFEWISSQRLLTISVPAGMAQQLYLIHRTRANSGEGFPARSVTGKWTRTTTVGPVTSSSTIVPNVV